MLLQWLQHCSGKYSLDTSWQGWMRCLHCHGGEALQTDGHSLARDRCYYCQHSKYGNGRMECEKCQVRKLGVR